MEHFPPGKGPVTPLSAIFPGIRVVLGAEFARARFSSAELGQGRAVLIENAADRVQRVAQRDATASVVKLVLQVRGEALVVQDGTRSRLAPGDLALFDGARSFAIECDRDYQQLIFQLPRAVVTRRYERLLGIVGARLAGDDPAHAMVFDLLSTMTRHVGVLSEERRAHALDTVLGLLGALEPANNDGPASRRRLLKALVDLETRLADPDLSSEILAKLQGISRRRMDAVFAEHGISVTSVIWERRLERVAEELGGPSKRTRRLLDVALSWGFNSEAHFSRSFRQKFGESPSAYRRRRSASV
jgi:AraC-like DNA-binding protein